MNKRTLSATSLVLLLALLLGGLSSCGARYGFEAVGRFARYEQWPDSGYALFVDYYADGRVCVTKSLYGSGEVYVAWAEQSADEVAAMQQSLLDAKFYRLRADYSVPSAGGCGYVVAVYYAGGALESRGHNPTNRRFLAVVDILRPGFDVDSLLFEPAP